jgi:hypothetical protein
MELSKHAMDTYIAPHMSEFTTGTIKDMSHHARELTSSTQLFALNSMFWTGLELATRQAMLNFIRRSEAAVRTYEEARLETLRYLDDDSINAYMRAMSSWETFLSQSWLGYALIMRIFRTKFFEPNDGSLPQRLNLLYNQTKHVESMIAGGNMAADSTLSVWLTNTGLESNDAAVTFDELSDVVENTMQWARRFGDPAAMKAAIERGEDLP